MTNTATRAKKEKITRTVTFKNQAHEDFYQRYLPKCRYQDVYHKALVYCLGIDRDTREVGNIKAYLLTTLYNASMTINSYYQAEVNHDLYGGG